MISGMAGTKREDVREEDVMICHYFTGMAAEDELLARLAIDPQKANMTWSSVEW
jgi:hypothetical protein